MNNTGLGVLINLLGGDSDSQESIQKCIGKKILGIKVDDSEVNIEFEDCKLKLWDDGQSCCEHRYMVCDDDLSYYVGKEFLGAEIKDAPDGDDNGECHEVQFLEIITKDGVINIANHNEHNGYYGGFSISAKYYKNK
jgi:hypothetical protein